MIFFSFHILPIQFQTVFFSLRSARLCRCIASRALAINTIFTSDMEFRVNCARLFFNYFCWLASAWFNVCRFVMDECACWINDIFVYEMNMLLMFVMNKVRYPYRCTMNVLVELFFIRLHFIHFLKCLRENDWKHRVMCRSGMQWIA